MGAPQQITGLSNPADASDAVTFLGQTSITDYTIGNTGFDIRVTHSHSGEGHAYSSGAILFTVAPDVPGGSLSYTATGIYAVRDGSTDNAGSVFFASSLYAFESSGMEYDSAQYSISAPNESFILGGFDGDAGNHSFGSLSGSLVAGHTYLWAFEAYVESWPGGDAGASASGHLALAFGGSTAGVPVPLPAAAWGGLALFGLIGARRLRRKHLGI